MTKEAKKRKRAYKFVVAQAKKVNWSPPIDSDARLAETLNIPIDEVNSLKKGLSDPSAKLITTFKNLVYKMTSETEIDSFLVKPSKK